MNPTTQTGGARPSIQRAAAAVGAALLTLLAVAALGTPKAGAETGTDPLVILVSNDDCSGADGIDALVEALRTRPDLTLIVSAPKENQSGKGDSTTPDAPAAPGTTKSGFAGTAVDGTPADSVQHALDNPGTEGAPDLVMTGSNEGQNIGFLAPLSGTVGAAQTGARAGIPALAVSQGFSDNPDYPVSVGAAMDWLDVHEAALRDGSEPVQVSSINAPTCTEGTNRGVVNVAWDGAAGTDVTTQDCTSTLANPASDVEAFNNGYISLSILPNDFPEAEEPAATAAPSSANDAPSSANDAPSSTDNAPASTSNGPASTSNGPAAAPLKPAFTG